jgi:hypothetical protein
MSTNSKKGKHVSVSKEVRQSISWLENFFEVKRVIIGRSEACRHRYSPGTLRTRSVVLGGININAYGGEGVTNVYVQISPKEKIADMVEMIKEKFNI